jgi:hypothetical protein
MTQQNNLKIVDQGVNDISHVKKVMSRYSALDYQPKNVENSK